MIAVSTEPLGPAIAEAWAPPPVLTVSEWADGHRILPPTSASRGGRWRTATVPYMAGVMDAILDPSVKLIAFMKSHQVGASESLLNIVGYHIQHDPCPMLFVQPTIEVAEAFSKERLTPMVREVPALAAVVRERRGPGSDSTLRLKVFPGGFLALAGANSPNTFARWSVRLAIADDVDRFPDTIEGEGDPADLLRNRTTTFYDGKAIFISTPSDKGGRIDTLYARSDQRRFFVPCARCGAMDYLTWHDPEHMHVVYEHRDPQTAHLRCTACHGRVESTERYAMVAAGEWRPTADPDDTGTAGFHIWAAYSPWMTLPDLVADWISKKEKGTDSLRVFINTSLGEGWADDAQGVDPIGLLLRRESYPTDADMPAGVAALTMGVDVQDDRLEFLVVGWGPGQESWLIDRGVLPGDTSRAEPWQALDEVIDSEYRHELGGRLRIRSTCIDSAGHRTSQVYEYVHRNSVKSVFATIGRDGPDRQIVSPPSPKRYGGREVRQVALYTVGVDAAKAILMARFRLTDKGPGYVHLPQANWADEELAHQLTSEVWKPRRGGGMAWVPIRTRNEMLDCFVLAHVALLLRNTPSLEHLAAEMRHQLASDRPPGPAAAEPRKDPWLTPRPGGWIRRR